MSDTDRKDIIDAAAAVASLVDSVRRLERKIGLAIHVSAPGVLVSYDATTQIGSVQLGFMLVPATESPVPTPVPIPPLPMVRVIQPKGATHFDHSPLAVGDSGLVLFTDRCLDLWYKTAVGEPVDPLDGRAHDLADAVFLPGLAPDAMVAAPITNPAARTIEAPTIQLGATATTPAHAVALQPVITALQVFATALKAAAVEPALAPAALALETALGNPAVAIPQPPGVASAKVRAE